MNLPKRIKLPALDRLRNRIPRVLEIYLHQFVRGLQDYNRALQDAITANTKTGTLIVDDGTNRVTLTYVEGKLTGATTGASVAQTMSWTDS